MPKRSRRNQQKTDSPTGRAIRDPHRARGVDETLSRALGVALQCCDIALQLADLSAFVPIEAARCDRERMRATDPPGSAELLCEGTSILSESCRGFMEILGVTARGVIELADDRFALAEPHLSHARRLAKERVDLASSGVLVALLDGMLELTCARKAWAAGQDAAARAHHREAHRRFAGLSHLRARKRPPSARRAGNAAEGAEETGAAPCASGGATATPAREPAADLELGPDGMWFRARGGERVSMRRRHAMRRLLLCLVERHEATPGQAIPMSALIEAGWLNERILPAAAMNRLYNTIAVLRSLGLGEMLHTAERGYALEPSVAVSLHPGQSLRRTKEL
ncbi:hypothetical protein ACMHYB_28640 [Sorangium sp. So ce1128]